MSRYPLSEDLQEKIRKHEAQKTKRAFVCLCCLNMCLPGVPNTSTFDYGNGWTPSPLPRLPCGQAAMVPSASRRTAPVTAADRDVDTLNKEAKAVLAAVLGPGWYELVEHIDSVASFGSGKTLFTVYLN